MGCDEFCNCILCLELKSCDKANLSSDNTDNFILTKPENVEFRDSTKYTFFGMEKDPWLNENPPKEEEDKNEENCKITENKHKSVIYVNDDLKTESIEDTSRITIKEIIDEYMSLDSLENSHVINVIFKNTFSLASQIIEDVRTCNEYYSDSSDDFPLGMEADMLKYYLEQRR